MYVYWKTHGCWWKKNISLIHMRPPWEAGQLLALHRVLTLSCFSRTYCGGNDGKDAVNSARRNVRW